MKRYLILICVAMYGQAFAQKVELKKPDYKKIESNINDSNSPLYYSQLMERYLRGDSTMNLEERRHLYYGYTFQKRYAPYARYAYSDSVRSLLAREHLERDDYERISTFSERELRENPFSLSAINQKLISAEHLQDTTDFLIHLSKMRIVFDALLSSGDGLSRETAFYVISTSHEYALLKCIRIGVWWRAKFDRTL